MRTHAQSLQWTSPLEPEHLSPGGVGAATRSGSYEPAPRAGSGRRHVRGPRDPFPGRATASTCSGFHNPIPRAGMGGILVIGAIRRPPPAPRATTRAWTRKSIRLGKPPATATLQFSINVRSLPRPNLTRSSTPTADSITLSTRTVAGNAEYAEERSGRCRKNIVVTATGSMPAATT